MSWRPLSVRGNPETATEYDALHEGVPEWLRAGARKWVEDTLNEGARAEGDLITVLQTVEQFLRYPLPWKYGSDSALAHLTNEVTQSGPRALDILDCCLMLSSFWSGVATEARASLDLMLVLSGSAWKVSDDPDGRPCLQRRVDETVEQAAKDTMEQSGNAARHLRLAWHRVYSRSPDASTAYREAVRAVEAVAKPVVSPNARFATLGTIINAMHDKPSKWTSDIGSIEVLAEMMRGLWTSQLDRHGTDDESVPLTVSQPQAEAAVHLAVILVHWFRNGHVRPV